MTRTDDVRYLTRFVRGLWPMAADLLGAEFTHQAVEQMDDDLPTWFPTVRVSRAHTRIDLDSDPGFVAHGPDGVALRIPSSGTHTFTSRVYLATPSKHPRVSPKVDLGFEVVVTPDAEPEPPDVEIDVDTNRAGTVVDWFLHWRDKIYAEVEDGDLQDELGFFGTARYDREAVPDIPDAVLRSPDRERLDGGVDLVLVPDGFSVQHPDRFEAIVEETVERLTSPDLDEPQLSEPWHSFKTALHVWTISPERSDDDRVVSSYDSAGSRRVSLGNLARLAAIGRVADDLGEGTTVVAYIADHLPRGARAMALGDLIMQPTQDEPAQGADYDPAGDVDLLLHELGHTSLGGLADEYVEGEPGGGRVGDGDRGDDEEPLKPKAADLDTSAVSASGVSTSEVSRHHVAYRGQPRQVPNLTTDPDLADFARWIDAPGELPSWDEHPVTGVEGGGYFGLGIWRPAEQCRMRDRRSGAPYCAVCREALTNGLRAALPDGRFLFRVRGPGRDEEYLQVEAEEDAHTASGQIVVPFADATDLRVTLVAATLPEPWHLDASFSGDGGLRRRRDHRTIPGGPSRATTWEFEARRGDRLSLEVRSRCPFTPWDRLPRYTVELHCEPDEHAVDPPATPVDLDGRQSSFGPPGTPKHVELSAVAEDPSGQDVRVEFEVTRAGQDVRGRVTARTPWKRSPAAGSGVPVETSHRVSMEGSYRFRARAQNRSGRRSGWSDEEQLTVTANRGPGGGGDDRRPPGGGNDDRPPIRTP